MLVGMGILAFLCIFLGVYPKILYDMLPYPVTFVPFTVTRVFSITQMFIFSFLGFFLLRKLVKGHPTYVLDTDWLVRIPGMMLIRFCKGSLIMFGSYLDKKMNRLVLTVVEGLRSPNIESRLSPMTIGFGASVALILFCAFLVLKI
jgi:multicomponent Na+:H+ antiporter subunit D